MFDYSSIALSYDSDPTGADSLLPENRAVYFRLKRVLDILCALVFLPVMIVIGIVLLALNPFFNQGPLLYVQKRMGRNCRAFPAIKFRTMRTATQIVRGADDPLEVHRITRLGWLLRKTRLDELPQILNVLRGDMSMIGPRPEQAKLTEVYEKQYFCYRFRHLVRPGITGWAQVNYKYGEDLNDAIKKFEYDLYYIRHFSIKLDASIILKTLTKIFMGAGR